MAHTHTDRADDKYYVPHSSPWPIFGAVAMFCTMVGASLMLNHSDIGSYVFGFGMLLVLLMFYFWFGNVIAESEGRMYNEAVDRSFRMGMLWFIFSEVMFFAVFFGALYYARIYSVPWLGGEGMKPATGMFLWKDFNAMWPTNGPEKLGGEFETIPAFGIPFINTMILLTSGVTVTIAHHAMKAGQRKILNIFLAATFLLGYFFVYMQAKEYIEAYHELNLKLSSGIYGSVSGSPTADVMTTGPITIPIMLRNGATATRAAATEAAASCGGAILPPVMGSVAFLMAEIGRASCRERVYLCV